MRTKKTKPVKKTRKKRTTIKEAYENGFKNGYRVCEESLILCTMEILDEMTDEYNNAIQRFPRNTKFVELQLDSILDLRERLIYRKEYTHYNEIISNEKNRVRPEVQS